MNLFTLQIRLFNNNSAIAAFEICMAEQDKKKKSGKWFKNLRNPYRLVILNDESLEERYSVKLTKLNMYIGLSSVLVMVVFLVTSLIVFTPLKQYIPGYGDVGIRSQIVDLQIKTDSLETLVFQQEAWIQNIHNVMRGDIFPDTSDQAELAADVYYDTIRLDKISPEEALLRERMEAEIQTSIIYADTRQEERLSFSGIDLISPLSGIVTQEFNPAQNHYGIDIVAAENSPVKAVHNGVVIFADWTVETGYVIGIQHPNNMISFYKHNAVLLKKVGNFVRTGDVIAIFGDSGELTTGPHLHFELWHNGLAVNPRDFIAF